jgi:hypothetical protein
MWVDVVHLGGFNQSVYTSCSMTAIVRKNQQHPIFPTTAIGPMARSAALLSISILKFFTQK